MSQQSEFYENNAVERRLDGELIAETPEQIAALFREFYETELGTYFWENFGLDTPNPKTEQTNAQVISAVFEKLYGYDPRLTISRIADCVETAIAAGALIELPEETEPAPVRDDAGRFATALQAEIRARLADPNTPASYFRERAATDAAFGDAWRKELVGKPPAPSTAKPSEEVIKFADAWRSAPSPKFLNGFCEIDGIRYTPAELDTQIASASQFGLL